MLTERERQHRRQRIKRLKRQQRRQRKIDEEEEEEFWYRRRCRNNLFQMIILSADLIDQQWNLPASPPLYTSGAGFRKRNSSER